ncbi:MAG: hypothetical protein AM324_006445 [Candidatus Thorarchaeota archaeon SMTZ1-83]|nr:MAG: hypothetical protein AM324_07580 [Candidatus Thorarchaeota archaeon SMTZ1-83]
MGLDSSVVERTSGIGSRIVRGCPCLKEFGREKVCLNNDDVMPITTITIDPVFFGNATSIEDLTELRSNSESMCYCLVFLDNDKEHTYCVSQGQLVKINGRPVKASEIQAALQFVSASEQAGDGVICSSCLYKYLITLGDTFEELLTDDERAELISSYLKRVTAQMAADLIGAAEHSDGQDSEILDDLISARIKELLDLRSEWTGVIHDLRSNGAESRIVSLVERNRLLTRLEGVFLFQVSTLRESQDAQISLGLLRFMIDVAERVVRIVEDIREMTRDLQETGQLPNEIGTLLQKHSVSRSKNVQWFKNLVRMLNQIETRTSQKSL